MISLFLLGNWKRSWHKYVGVSMYLCKLFEWPCNSKKKNILRCILNQSELKLNNLLQKIVSAQFRFEFEFINRDMLHWILYPLVIWNDEIFSTNFLFEISIICIWLTCLFSKKKKKLCQNHLKCTRYG